MYLFYHRSTGNDDLPKKSMSNQPSEFPEKIPLQPASI